jgi:glucan-binding YG repeat protein
MRKQTKLAVGISAAALLAVGASMTALAATGWVNEGGSWYYYNSSGDYVTDAWKSYNGTYFYLGDDGAMLTNQLIEDGDNWYYVDANGAMVKNTWVAVPADDSEILDVEYRWYYFGSTGKAYKNSKGKTINGKKYGFDEEGKMLFGYVEQDSYNIIQDEDDPILNAEYYYGTNEDGARHTGWLQYTDALTDYDWDYYWFYFNTSNGKKVAGQLKNINGKRYSFKDNGIMEKEWAKATVGGNETTTWWHGLADGSLSKNQWIWNKPYNTEQGATQPRTIEDNENDTQRWFRTNASGALVKGVTKKVNGKWYVFDEDGVMRVKLVVLDQEGVSGAKYVKALDMDNVTKADLVKGDDGTGYGGKLHWFSDDEEHDGSMKTGTFKIELADDTYTFKFAKTTGAAKHGIDSKKIYNNGILEKGGDDKYKVVLVNDAKNGDRYFLVGTTGSIVTSAGRYKDANDIYYVIAKNTAENPSNMEKGFRIFKTADEEQAKKAVQSQDFSGLTVAESTSAVVTVDAK